MIYERTLSKLIYCLIRYCKKSLLDLSLQNTKLEPRLRCLHDKEGRKINILTQAHEFKYLEKGLLRSTPGLHYEASSALKGCFDVG